MGFGFRCGFLGLLHMEIVQERLEREYNLDLIITAPTVVYRCTGGDGGELLIDNPCELPDSHQDLREPYVRCAAARPDGRARCGARLGLGMHWEGVRGDADPGSKGAFQARFGARSGGGAAGQAGAGRAGWR